MKRLLAAVLLVCGALCAAGCDPGPAPEAPTAAVTASPTPEFAVAVEWRKAKDLPYDLGHIRRVEADATSIQWPGFKLTPEESRQIEAREAEFAQTLESLVLQVEASPVFAGFWLEQPAGTATVAATDPVAMGVVVADFPALRVTIVPARYTYAELDALKEQVVADSVAGVLGDIRVTFAGVDVKANRLQVGVEDLTPWKRMQMFAHYGPRIVVTEAEPATPL